MEIFKCESCKIMPVEMEEPASNGNKPYRLCAPCQKRLINKALRPLEFFNLAAIHGHGFYLHDDFYDFDTGEATQPSIPVEDKSKYPFPDPNGIKSDLSKLVDYACVQYFTTDSVILQLKTFDKKDVLAYLQFKVNYNRAINYKAYEVAAKVLGPFSEDWIRNEWSSRKTDELMIFAEALAMCLPFDEAFEAITNNIDKSTERRLADDMLALLYFQSNKTLSWIEDQIKLVKNISANWGMLAAASQFDWSTANKWLDQGRPLSLIALDALTFCTTTGERHNMALWFQKNTPKLLNPEKPEIIADRVTKYLEKDNVPRTKSAVRRIINNLFETTI